VTVSRKASALLPLKWRKTFGLESGGPCDAQELNDGKGRLVVDSASKARRGAKGLLATCVSNPSRSRVDANLLRSK